MSAMIISAFPGCGKSYCTANTEGLKILDSDSSKFSWIYKDGVKTDERNPEFPANYIAHIKENIKTADVIFVSSHENVRQALKEANITYISVFPALDAKEEFMERFKNRGDNEAFLNLLDTNWEKWIDQLVDDESNPALEKFIIKGEDFLDEELLADIHTVWDNAVFDDDDEE